MAAKNTGRFDWRSYAEQILDAVDFTLSEMVEKQDKRGRPFLYGQTIRHGFRIQIFVIPVTSNSVDKQNKISLK